MKYFIGILFICILPSCCTYNIEFPNNMEYRNNYELVQKIIENPEIILELCNDNLSCTENFAEEIQSLSIQKYYIFLIEKYFQCDIRFVKEEFLYIGFKVHRMTLSNISEENFIYFDFELINGKWKLSLIQIGDPYL